MKNIFSNILSKYISDYEHREEQILMAEAVRDTIKNKKTLLIEAGTGVGKTMGYLLPLAEYAIKENKKIIISTYSKALQQQIYKKDMLAVKKVFPEIKYNVVFGTANYICKNRMNAFSNKEGLFTASGMKNILEFIKTGDGVRENLKFHLPDEIWREINRDREICMDAKCEYFKKCYYFNIRKKLSKSHIIIVNHYLYFSDVLVARALLPEADIVVFDEAHRVEDVIRDTFSKQFSSVSFFKFLTTIENFMKDYLSKKDMTHIHSYIINLRYEMKEFLEEINSKFFGDKKEYLLCDFKMDRDINIKNFLKDVIHELDVLKKKKEISKNQKNFIDFLLLKIEEYSEVLNCFLYKKAKNCFYWIEAKEKNFNFFITPYKIRDIYKENVENFHKSVIFTSATLSVDKNFEYIKNQFGLNGVNESILNSPFNHKEQSVLYLEENLPFPSEDSFEKKLSEKIYEIIEITKGGVMFLFTNINLMNNIYRKIKNSAGKIPIFIQGEMNSSDLIENFKKKPSILFATYSFWQGIDIKGKALKCVVITRLPFEMPDHPVQKALYENIRREGRDHFNDYALPRAVFMLKQGFGRLIRSKKDYGAVMILDKRIKTKNYGKKFIYSLPDVNITSNIEDIKKFFKEKTE